MSDTDRIERWKRAAEAFGFAIPPERIERMAPGLEALLDAARPALRRDYRLTDPVTQFRPDGK
jgi:hypothetical protein